MKIEVNLEKRYALMLLGFAFVLAGVIVVYAYNSGGSGGTPSVMGHSVDEINFAQTITSVKPSDIVLGTGDYNVGTSQYTRFISTQGRVGGIMHSRTGAHGTNTLSLFSYDDKTIVLRPDPLPTGNGIVNVKGDLIVDGVITSAASGAGGGPGALLEAAWVGYKWVDDGTTLGPCTSSNNVRHWARINNGNVELRIDKVSGSPQFDTGWVNNRVVTWRPNPSTLPHTTTIEFGGQVVGRHRDGLTCSLSF
jgi:hypothetical protein